MIKMKFTALVKTLLLVLVTWTGISSAKHAGAGGIRSKTPARSKTPVRVFILAGQSNMAGKGNVAHLAKIYPNATEWRERDDVHIRFNDRHGKLKVGYGVPENRNFGPELGFGNVVGDYFQDENILLIKSAYEGTSLANEWRPPLSKEFNHTMCQEKHATFADRHAVVQGTDTPFPYMGGMWANSTRTGYKITGLDPGKLYDMKLGFSEKFYCCPGANVFVIKVKQDGDDQTINDFDIAAESYELYGKYCNQAVDKWFRTLKADASGELSFELHAGKYKGKPHVALAEVWTSKVTDNVEASLITAVYFGVDPDANTLPLSGYDIPVKENIYPVDSPNRTGNIYFVTNQTNFKRYFVPVTPEEYGLAYREMIEMVQETLADIKTYIPSFEEGSKVTLEGFVWFQGWNDFIHDQFREEYGDNLANLIDSVRHDLDEPNLPFLVGELGQNRLGRHGKRHGKIVTDGEMMSFRDTQKGVTEMDEFRNNTVFVETHPYFVEEWDLGGVQYDGVRHYYGRADTFLNIGRSFGEAMLKLMGHDVSIMEEQTESRL